MQSSASRSFCRAESSRTHLLPQREAPTSIHDSHLPAAAGPEAVAVLHHLKVAHEVEVHAAVVGMVAAKHHRLIHGDRDPCQGPGPGPDPLRPPHVVVDTARVHLRTQGADQEARHHRGVAEADVMTTTTADGAVQVAIVMVAEEEGAVRRGTGDATVERIRAKRFATR